MHKKLPKIHLLQRRKQWTLTVQGWIMAVFTITAVIILSITNIQPFLAVNSPIPANILVVEGWLTDYALKQAITEFKSGSYRQIITTGGPLPTGYYLAEYKTFAKLAAATLQKLNIEKEQLIAVPAPEVIKDRTYASAVALRQWLLKSNLPIKSINLYTFDVHARRSWLIFKKVLAPIKVGVITVKSLDYNANKWWSSSEGVRAIISETIAYIYARFVNLQA